MDFDNIIKDLLDEEAGTLTEEVVDPLIAYLLNCLNDTDKLDDKLRIINQISELLQLKITSTSFYGDLFKNFVEVE